MGMKKFKRVDDANMEELAAAGVARAKAARELSEQEITQVSGAAAYAPAMAYTGVIKRIEWYGIFPPKGGWYLDGIDQGAIENISNKL